MKNTLFKGMMAFAVSATLMAGSAVAQTIKWDMPNEYQATTIHGEGDTFFKGKLKELSAGKIEVVNHFGGALGYKSAQQLDAVADGAVPIADSYAGAFGGVDPIFELPSLPFLAKNFEDSKALYDIAKPYYDKVFAKNNQKLLYATPWSPSGIWAKKPADSLASIKNLKIRTYDKNGAVTLKEAGAAAVQLSWADVVPSLGAGAIEAVLSSAEGGVGGKLWEHVSHFTEINYATPLSMVHMNLDEWNKLTPDLQKAVLDAAAATEAHNWSVALKRDQQNYAKMRSNGMTIVTGASDEYLAALAKAGQVALNSWLKKTGEDGKAIIAAYEKR